MRLPDLNITVNARQCYTILSSIQYDIWTETGVISKWFLPTLQQKRDWVKSRAMTHISNTGEAKL